MSIVPHHLQYRSSATAHPCWPSTSPWSDGFHAIVVIRITSAHLNFHKTCINFCFIYLCIFFGCSVHVGSSQTRARAHVPCIGRWILNHCATREALFSFFFFKDVFWLYLFIYFWLCWVFVSVRGLPLAAASGGHSLSWPLLRSTGSRRSGSVVVAHGPSCSAACGILPDQGSNPCPLHWQADSQPLHHQGSSKVLFTMEFYLCLWGPSGSAQWFYLPFFSHKYTLI